ncbi:MAG: NAD(P)-dependent oxidoreductase [Thermodesulfobacteriota bacterium]
MKVLITGAGGFIGSNLAAALLEKGAEVIALDIAREPAALAGMKDGLAYVRGDLASAEDLYRTMMIHRPTDVFHLGSVLAGPCDENPALGFKINFGSTLALLDAAAELKVRRFTLASSIAVFGQDVPEPVRDDAPKNPANIYGQTKLACEHLLRWYARAKGLDGRAVRFTWVFGPGRTTGITALYSSLLLDAVARGETVEVPNPDEIGDWLYVKDAVRALLILHEAEEAPQRIYNIAGGVHSIREVLTLALELKPGAKVLYGQAGRRMSPYPAVYDDTPAREQLGWRPEYSIEKAVEEHLAVVSARIAGAKAA